MVSVEITNEQMAYFSCNKSSLTRDLHSTKARLGINQAKLGDFDLKENKISYEAGFWFYIREYAVGCTIDELMTPGLEVGKIYLRNRELKYSTAEMEKPVTGRFGVSQAIFYAIIGDPVF